MSVDWLDFDRLVYRTGPLMFRWLILMQIASVMSAHLCERDCAAMPPKFSMTKFIGESSDACKLRMEMSLYKICIYATLVSNCLYACVYLQMLPNRRVNLFWLLESLILRPCEVCAQARFHAFLQKSFENVHKLEVSNERITWPDVSVVEVYCLSDSWFWFKLWFGHVKWTFHFEVFCRYSGACWRTLWAPTLRHSPTS